jgi:hypothetical protein
MRWPFGRRPTILFLGGLSGAGKSTLARECLQCEHAWRHIEIDVPPPGDGITDNGLRAPWEAFLSVRPDRPRPRGLYRAIKRLSSGRSHIVLSFSSLQVFEQRQLDAARPYFHFAYLVGPEKHCLQAFLDREHSARTLPMETDLSAYWRYNNERLLDALDAPHVRPYRVQAFELDGRRRRREVIYGEIINMIIERT